MRDVELDHKRLKPRLIVLNNLVEAASEQNGWLSLAARSGEAIRQAHLLLLDLRELEKIGRRAYNREVISQTNKGDEHG